MKMKSLFLSLLLLAGCSYLPGGDDEKPPLPGERISILELQSDLKADADAFGLQAFTPPAPYNNDSWPQAGGFPNHALQNLALNDGALQQVWRTDIGKGASGSLPLTAQPVVAAGFVFTLDTRSRVSAFQAQDGKRIWTADVQDEDEDDPVIGGGVSYANGILYVTAGYDEILALNHQDGTILWRSKLSTPARAAPTIMNGRVFVTTLNNTLFALDARDGAILWDFEAGGKGAGLLGAASPAANKDIVVPAFSSGEIHALRVENGSIAWSDNLASVRRSSGLGGLSDITGLPVIDRGLVFAISYGGKMVAVDETTGNRVWQRDIAGSQTPWVSGNQVFVLTSDNLLASIGRDSGVVRWVQQLKRHTNEKKKTGDISWTGPVFAGGRLITASSEGHVLELSPQDGQQIRAFKTGRGISIAPVVAGGTLYLLGNDGTLFAYR